ncbi:hypothetical protein KAH37_06950 [bacterium]|nr:hypothetical protein [bacterium]
MKRGVSIVIVLAALFSLVISLFPALKSTQAFLMESFIIVLATAVLYGILSLFYRSFSMIGDEGDTGWHGFFIFLGFMTLPILLLVSSNTAWFAKSELLFSYPEIVPAVVELEMDKEPYLANMPLKKQAILVVSQMTAPSWNPTNDLLVKAGISMQSLREMVQKNAPVHNKKIDELFSAGDAKLFAETAYKVSRTLNILVRHIAKGSISQQECSVLGVSPKTEELCSRLKKYRITPSKAVIRTVMRTVIHPLQTTFFALLLFYLLVSIVTFKSDKKATVLLFLGTAVLTLLTQIPLVIFPSSNHALSLLERLLLIPTIAVYRAVILGSGVAFLLYLFYVLYIVIKGRVR